MDDPKGKPVRDKSGNLIGRQQTGAPIVIDPKKDSDYAQDRRDEQDLKDAADYDRASVQRRIDARKKAAAEKAAKPEASPTESPAAPPPTVTPSTPSDPFRPGLPVKKKKQE